MSKTDHYDELTQINNELVNMQRELVRQNMALQQARDDLEFANLITLKVSQGHDLNMVFRTLAEIITQHFDASGTEVHVFDDDRMNFTCVVDYSSTGGYHEDGEILGTTWSMEILTEPCQQRLLAGEILIIDGVDNTECMTEYLRSTWRNFGTQVGAVVPISKFNQVIGFLHVWSHDKAKRFIDREQQLLTIVSQHVAGVLGMSETLKLEREARQRAEIAERAFQKTIQELELLNYIATGITTDTNLEDSLLEMAIRLAHHLCVFRIRIKILDISSQKWHVEVDYVVPTEIDCSTIFEDSDESPVFVNDQVHAQILKGQTVLTENIEYDQHESEYYRLNYLHDNIHTRLAVPLFGYPDITGMMALYLDEKHRHFSDDEIRLVENVARETSKIIGLMRALKAKKNALRQAECIMKVTETFTQSLDIDVVVQTVLNELRQVIVLDSAYLYLIDDDILVLASSTDETDDIILPLWQDKSGTTHDFLRSSHITNIEEIDQTGDIVYSTLSIPLLVADESIGLLVISGPNGYHYSDLDKTLIKGIVTAATIAIHNARLHMSAHRQAALQERQRLARDLHDSVTQSLYGLTLLASGWAKMAAQGRLDNPESNIRELGELGQQGLKEMRLLIHQLREPQLEKVGLIEALQQRLDAVEKRVDIDVQFTADIALVDVSLAFQEHIFYIVQEALNNSLRHAKATTVHIHIGLQGHQIIITVEDNGLGFDTRLNMAGMGLENMKTRAKLIGAELIIDSHPQKGTTITVEIQHNN